MKKKVTNVSTAVLEELGLTAAQHERLSLLMEEMGETIQVVGKILRHGILSRNPLQNGAGPTNRMMLEKELGDVLLALRMLYVARDLSVTAVAGHEIQKAAKVRRWLHHQEKAVTDLLTHMAGQQPGHEATAMASPAMAHPIDPGD